jgi:type I restriction enzyme, S subunit
MSDPPRIDIRPDHWAIVRDILLKHVPQHEVWAFGSRAKWTAKQYSDLDLVVISDQPLPLAVSAGLSDDFSESDLPYRVDVVDWATTGEAFKKIIERDRVVVQRQVPGGDALCKCARHSHAAWPRVRIGEVAEVFDGPHATPEKTPFGPVFLGISALNRGRLDLASTEHLSQEDFVKWTRRVTPRAGDVVFSYETRIGEAAIIPEGLQCCLGRRMGLVRAKPDRLDPHFFLYQYLSPPFQDFLASHTVHGSTVDRVPLKDFPSFEIDLPPLQVQKHIAQSMSQIDAKIEINRRINQTLEAVAQAIFKSWFVDFDPVKAKIAAKAEGRHPLRAAMSAISGKTDAELDALRPEQHAQLAATAALFPETLESSDLGEIPKGWAVARIQDVVEGVYDGPHATPPEATDGPVFLGIRNMTGTSLDLGDIRHIAETDWAQWTRRVVPCAGDIVFSYEATLGYFAMLPPDLRCCLGRRLALIRPRGKQGCGTFWFHQFISRPFQRFLAKHTIPGATVNRIALKDFPSFPVLNPATAVRLAFAERADRIWSMVHAKQAESQKLVTMREALLPKLLSGDLSVATHEVEAIA